MIRALLLLLLTAMLCSLAAPAVAQVASNTAPLEFRDSAEEARFHALAEQLRCVMCQNQSLADSNAQIARDLRAEVLDLMRQGKDDAQIKEFLVQRYGEFVLYKPRMQLRTWLLWFGPLLIVAAAAYGLWRIVRKRNAAVAALPKADDAQEW